MKKETKTTPAGQRSRVFKEIWRFRWAYLLVLPFFGFLVVFRYFPMYGILLAFKNFKPLEGIMGSPWAGTKYFEQLFKSYSFWQVMRNTLIITGSKLLISFPMPIILAIFVNEIRNKKMKKVFQTISYLPHFLSWVVVAPILYNVFALNGPINWIITKLGGEATFFWVMPQYFRKLVIVTDIWKGVGWSSIIYLAAITAIDPGLYEAAEIDGANKLRKIWHITIPGIRSTIITLFIMQVGSIMSAGFDQIFNMYSESTLSTGDILDTFVYRQGIISANYSFGTAAGLFMNVVGFGLLIITNLVVNKLTDGEEGLF